MITLTRASSDETPVGELVEKIRTAIQSSDISKEWTIEKISILGSEIDLGVAPKIPGESELVVAGLPQTPEKKNPSCGD